MKTGEIGKLGDVSMFGCLTRCGGARSPKSQPVFQFCYPKGGGNDSRCSVERVCKEAEVLERK